MIGLVRAVTLCATLAFGLSVAQAADKAFNVVNGDVFRWRKMWGRIAGYFGIEAAPYPGQPNPLATTLADAGPDWEKLVARHGLKPNRLEAIAPWWHVDADLGRTQECMADMSRSRELGFLDYQSTWLSFVELFDTLRREKIIP